MIRKCYVCENDFSTVHSKKVIVEKYDGTKDVISRLLVDGNGPFYFCNSCILPYMKGVCDAGRYDYKSISLGNRLTEVTET